MADTLVLGTSAERRESSNLSRSTTLKDKIMKKFTDELRDFGKRLGEDGYPTALIERAAKRMDDMEALLIEHQAIEAELERAFDKAIRKSAKKGSLPTGPD